MAAVAAVAAVAAGLGKVLRIHVRSVDWSVIRSIERLIKFFDESLGQSIHQSIDQLD